MAVALTYTADDTVILDATLFQGLGIWGLTQRNRKGPATPSGPVPGRRGGRYHTLLQRLAQPDPDSDAGSTPDQRRPSVCDAAPALIRRRMCWTAGTLALIAGLAVILDTMCPPYRFSHAPRPTPVCQRRPTTHPYLSTMSEPVYSESVELWGLK